MCHEAFPLFHENGHLYRNCGTFLLFIWSLVPKICYRNSFEMKYVKYDVSIIINHRQVVLFQIPFEPINLYLLLVKGMGVSVRRCEIWHTHQHPHTHTLT